MMEEKTKDLIRAAGGLVWRDSPRGRELLLVHRARYNDWSLPKGKLKPGETWLEAAQREVIEETGLQIIEGKMAGDTFYYVNDRPKIVLFWHMLVVGEIPPEQVPSGSLDEVSDVRWVLVPQELDKMTYEAERKLILTVYKIGYQLT